MSYIRSTLHAIGDRDDNARAGFGGRQLTNAAAVWVLLGLALAASAACGGGEPEPRPPAQPRTAGEAETAAYLSERTMELWVVYNTYDLHGLSAFYEASYWLEEEEELQRNMAPFESRGVTFAAEETSPPRQIEPGRWEVRHTARFDGGSVNMTFIYEHFDGEWLLTYAESD